jgi:peptidoglycan/LPS O-acetylase OafA/YrhL
MQSRLLSIDVLRLFACILVLGRHADWPQFAGPTAPFFEAWYTGGWAGVDLFFVLSGFLIGGLLFAELKRSGAIRVKRFLVRRGWKIYPAFYVMIGFTLFFTTVNRIAPFSWYDTLSEIFFLQNYGGHLSLQTWSLAVEEHFYLLLPFLLLALRGRLQYLPWVVACVAVLCLAVRVTIGQPGAFIYTHARIDSLLFGVLLAYLQHFHTTAFMSFVQRFRAALALIGVAFVAPAFVYDCETTPWMSTIGLTMLYVGYGLIVAAAIAREWKPTGPIVYLARLGSHSYSIYLWHGVVLFWGIPILERAIQLPFNPWVSTAAYMVASIALGVFMARMIELPCLKLRDRLTQDRPAFRSTLPTAQPAGA